MSKVDFGEHLPWQKGRTKEKTGGRRLGTPNRKSQIFSDELDALGFNVAKELVNLIPLLSYENQALILLRTMEYIYPKRKPIEFENEEIELSSEKNIANETIDDSRDNEDSAHSNHQPPNS